MYFWSAWPRSDARRVREPDHWVSSEMRDAPYCATSHSWIAPRHNLGYVLGCGLGVLWKRSCKPWLHLVTITHDLTQDPPMHSSSPCSPFQKLIISFLDTQPLLVFTTTNTCSLYLASSVLSLVYLWLAIRLRTGQQLIASNSSLATSNSNLTKEVKTLRNQLPPKSRSGVCRVIRSNTMSVTTLILCQIVLKCMI